MRITSILPLLGTALLANSPAGATPITYSLVNQGGGILLTGNIVTDGVIGTLSQSDHFLADHGNRNVRPRHHANDQ